MKKIEFANLRKTNCFELDLKYALEYCTQNNIDELVFEKGKEYNYNEKYCFQRDLAVSNHGYNGRKRVAVLLENISDFTLDFNYSTLIFNSVIMPMAILNCQNIKIKNLSVENTALDILYSKVLSYENDSCIVENINQMPFVLMGNKMFTSCEGRVFAPVDISIEFNGQTCEIEKNTGDNTLGREISDLDFYLLEDKKMRISRIKRRPPIGNILAFDGGHRFSAGIFAEKSKNISFESIDIYSTFGMGLIAQCCENIKLNRFNTKRKGINLCTTQADATHFVQCYGNITVQNCTFEGMLDDALNIHGIYTKIVSKSENAIFVKEIHSESKGIRIYNIGDKVNVVNKKSLISYSEKTIKSVKYINDELIYLKLNETTDDIIIGDSLENVTYLADLVFINNIVRNNRARGMLIANKGTNLISNNYFHTSGSAIKFESDGEFWFESGGVGEVLIENNEFDYCNYGDWGEYVIECQPRSLVEEDKYFHKKISIINNKFKLKNENVIKLDNVEDFICKDNHFSVCNNKEAKIVGLNIKNKM